MYEHSVDTVLHGTGNETFEAVRMLKAADPEKYTPAAARIIARKVRRQPASGGPAHEMNLGVEVAFADIGGWTIRERRQRAGADGQPHPSSRSRSLHSGPTSATLPRRPSSSHVEFDAPRAKTATAARSRPRECYVRPRGPSRRKSTTLRPANRTSL